MVYFTSDLHLGHQRDFLYEPRGFKNIYEHDKALLSNWNEMITEEDDVYILGDICLNDLDYGLGILKRLRGRLHIIRGNHDTDKKIEEYMKCHNVVEISDSKYMKASKSIVLFLNHYPVAFREDSRHVKTIWTICGHCHTQDKFSDVNMKCIHAEMDCRNMRPVSFETIVKEINELKGMSRK